MNLYAALTVEQLLRCPGPERVGHGPWSAEAFDEHTGARRGWLCRRCADELRVRGAGYRVEPLTADRGAA